jgi:thiamine-phosphate pyrophosphorylase
MALRSSDDRPILCAVLDAASLGRAPAEAAQALFAAGVDWIQLRDRSLEDDRLLNLAIALVEGRDRAGGRSANPRVLLNRRIDVALAAGADGVHLGFDALAADTAARLMTENALLGLSLHSTAEVAASIGQGACYAHLAPIWNPISKPASRPALGTAALSHACSLGLPILAQGGIDAERACEAIASGASGVAVTGRLADPTSRLAAARELRAAVDSIEVPTGSDRGRFPRTDSPPA